MSHEWIHLNIYVIKKDPFIVLLAIFPFSHPNESMSFHVAWNALASSFDGKMHGESFIGHPIGHVPIEPSQLINVFSCHIRMHLPLHPMGKIHGESFIVHPFGHPPIQPSWPINALSCHEEDHLPLHQLGKCKGISHWTLCMSFHY
jgi:hypothetical protein